MGQDESSLDLPPRTLEAKTLAAVAAHMPGKRVVVLTGAGISTAAGIPDFRSPKTGLYNQLARLDLPYAEAVFDIDYFRQHPEPFYALARELYPGRFHPTVSHVFIALLARKGLLQMLFTQNIDCLERSAGVPDDKIVEAHGSFATQRCIECKTPFPDDRMRAHVEAADVPHCLEPSCGGLVKPDIVFFGEPLPSHFSQNAYHAAMADLVLVLGTSLSVHPFAGLPDVAPEAVPRVLFNMERAGHLGRRPDDVVHLGPVDDSIRALADELGWRHELEDMWRALVGEDEAERQLKRRPEGDDLLELADGLHSLDLDESDGSDDLDDEKAAAVEATLDANAAPGAPAERHNHQVKAAAVVETAVDPVAAPTAPTKRDELEEQATIVETALNVRPSPSAEQAAGSGAKKDDGLHPAEHGPPQPAEAEAEPQLEQQKSKTTDGTVDQVPSEWTVPDQTTRPSLPRPGDPSTSPLPGNGE
ncbi:hypothetical protein DCS_00129 [Drechmeria coniospora]|uniref:Deacetylase sirtuin-type domain-containing protein n=1 Tax=Drechmeria coniospora TaxID=98403 RepID=A0A151GPS0_DRECN|nr:hypothetical protein DCS_00129 [Drechmeria coniospora]KYK59002.1 hypothetical protein DCS_00129 [Drechmeria coniospora]ODA76503.1 hypothetical protein RJ55_07773 [Drechmeria coniospora]